MDREDRAVIGFALIFLILFVGWNLYNIVAIQEDIKELQEIHSIK